MAELYEERRAFVDDILSRRRWCEFPGCTKRSDDVHEPKTRARGGSILDEANTMAVCWEHHRWIHDNVAEATERGFLRHSWDP